MKLTESILEIIRDDDVERLKTQFIHNEMHINILTLSIGVSSFKIVEYMINIIDKDILFRYKDYYFYTCLDKRRYDIADLILSKGIKLEDLDSKFLKEKHLEYFRTR